MEMMDLYGNQVRRDNRRNNGSRAFDPKELHQRNHEILNLHALGMKNTQIANALNVTTATVSNTVNSSLGQEKLAIVRGARDNAALEVMDKIDEMTPKALETLQDILEDEDKASLSLKRLVARDILIDLGGHAAPKKFDVRTAVLTPEFFEELRDQGRQAVIDVDSE